MSDSYKNVPIVKGTSRIGNQKRLANKRIRKVEDIPSGKAYRRVYPTDNVIEYASRETLESLLKAYETDEELQRQFSTEEELRAFWKKEYIGK